MSDEYEAPRYGNTDVRVLSMDDLPAVFDLLTSHPDLNLFILGDLENYGTEQPFQDVWGEFTDGILTSVLLRYHDSFVVSQPGPIRPEAFRQIIAEYSAAFPPGLTGSGGRHIVASGSEPVIRSIAGSAAEIPQSAAEGRDDPESRSRMPLAGTLRTMHFARIDSPEKLPATSEDRTVRIAGVEDVPRLMKLYESIDEFVTHETQADELRSSIRAGHRTVAIVEAGEDIVSTASTAAENSRSAMIVGVATHPAYRYRGHARACLSHLCRELLEQNRILCLFYDNLDAGRLYRQIGFRETDRWAIFSLEH
ncbi:MAG: GNAT family N-acetyltransferase [Spirochaetaceae bacterium]|nr:MAG: GNAT family N-acetyltransferase [Spirochaetaceae bacterium]